MFVVNTGEVRERKGTFQNKEHGGENTVKADEMREGNRWTRLLLDLVSMYVCVCVCVCERLTLTPVSVSKYKFFFNFQRNCIRNMHFNQIKYKHKRTYFILTSTFGSWKKVTPPPPLRNIQRDSNLIGWLSLTFFYVGHPWTSSRGGGVGGGVWGTWTCGS